MQLLTYFVPFPYWTRSFPPIVGVRWFNIAVLTITPAIALYGFMKLSLRKETMIFSMLYYIFSMLGVHFLSWNFLFVLKKFIGRYNCRYDYLRAHIGAAGSWSCERIFRLP